MSDRNVTKKIRWYSFSKIARQIEELKMTTFFKKFASETHICSASSDSRLCKRQNRHLRLPQTHVDVNRRILTKKINFPASRSGDFNGATPSVYLFNILVIINREEKPNPILKDISVMMRFEPKKNLPKTF